MGYVVSGSTMKEPAELGQRKEEGEQEVTKHNGKIET